jgi:hypothetical protein
MAAFFSDATTPQRGKDHTPENRHSRYTFQSIVNDFDGTGSGAAKHYLSNKFITSIVKQICHSPLFKQTRHFDWSLSEVERGQGRNLLFLPLAAEPPKPI